MTIPQAFVYCPKCSVRGLKPGSRKSVVCADCGFEFFFNPAAAVAGIISNDKGQLLVGVRAADPGKGWLDLPGGFVDPGETAEQALAREIKEELNLDVDSMEYMMSAPNTYYYKGITYHTLDLAFVCHVSDLTGLKAQDDIAAAQFIPPEEIDPARFFFPSIRVFIEQFIQTGKL